MEFVAHAEVAGGLLRWSAGRGQVIQKSQHDQETGDDTGLYTPEKRVWGDRELAYPPIAIV